jgi:hypothetical protein
MINLIGINLNYQQQEFDFILDKEGHSKHQYIEDVLSGINKDAFYKPLTAGYAPKIRLMSEDSFYNLRVEVCPAKLIYGNNLYEVETKDFNLFIQKLTEALEFAGIKADPLLLCTAHCYKVDYAKLFITEHLPSTVMDIMQRIPCKGHRRKSITTYLDDGKAIYGNLKNRKLKIYDKVAELLQDKSLSQDFKDKVAAFNGSIFRIEYSITRAKEIRRELIGLGLKADVSLDYLFNVDKAKLVLQKNIGDILSRMITVDMDNYVANLSKVLKDKKIKRADTLSSYLCAPLFIEKYGLDIYKRILTEILGKDSASHNIGKIQELNIPKSKVQEEIVKSISNALNDMTPITEKDIDINS